MRVRKNPYRPAAAYEFVKAEGNLRLQISASDCRTCNIKDPTQNIVWMTMEGSGPNYAESEFTIPA
jgi:electron-transferring-flavoprotein dehydrogenase